MASLFKRIAFQVGDNIGERTHTYSSVSKDGHYISLRPFVEPKSAAENEFPFEWAFAGTNKNVVVTKLSDREVQQDFNFWFDLNAYQNIPNTHRGVINSFWETWESGCLKETGKVFPSGPNGEGVSFMELWQPLDANCVSETMATKVTAAQPTRSVVLQIDSDKYQGLIIVVGKWAQGFLAQKDGSDRSKVSFIRSVEHENAYKTVLSYGKETNKFPNNFKTYRIDELVEVDDLVWKVIESNN